MDSSDWIELVTAGIAALGFGFTIYRLWENNDRASAELAVRLMCDWSNYLDDTTDRCIRIVAQIQDSELSRIWQEQAVQLPVELFDTVHDLLTSKFEADKLPFAPDPDSPTFPLNELNAGFIRFHWTTYLNRLESSLTAWDQGVARSSIMELQFRQLLIHRKSLLKKLIDAVHEDDCFPVTQDYLEQLKKNNRIRPNPRRLLRRP